MSQPDRRTVSTAALLGLSFLCLLAAAAGLMEVPGSPAALPGLGLAGMTVTGLLAIRGLLRRERDTAAALAEGERYSEAVAELSQDIHAIIATQGSKFLYLNQAVANVLGYAQEEFMRGGLPFLNSLVHPEDLPALRGQFARLLPAPAAGRGAEEIHEQVFRVRDHRGLYHWMKSRMLVFARHPSGQAAEVLAVLHDVTEQRVSEAALLQARRQESLGALTRGALHDLNNTLMGIQGFTEIALAGLGNPEALRGNLEKVRASMLRASALSRQMVTYAGSGAGRLRIAPGDLNEVVRGSLPELESLLPAGGQLELDLAADLPPAALDPEQARYALLNLVFNAAEAIRVAGGQIVLRTRAAAPGPADASAPELAGGSLCLEVQDSGPGKPAELVEQIFDPLFPAKWPGQGLGLSAVQGILREHQGAVRHASGPGQGNTTTLCFPRAERVPALDPGDEGTPVAGVSGVILLVDDEPAVRAILRQGLEMAGFKVLEAADGVDGLKAFVRHRSSISLVLLDLTMPRRGGEEVFQEIHQLAPEVPVVLMSGYSEQEATAALASRGLAGFLAKPCSIKDALAVVERALRGSTAPVS
jgi:PAS domain S-box-containing protein